MSETTTVKVPVEVRDRLASAARTRGITMRSLLDELSQHALDAAEMDRASEQMSRMKETDPDAWAEYIKEGREWEEGTVERLPA